jgi:hypothetical protein
MCKTCRAKLQMLGSVDAAISPNQFFQRSTHTARVLSGWAIVELWYALFFWNTRKIFLFFILSISLD